MDGAMAANCACPNKVYAESVGVGTERVTATRLDRPNSGNEEGGGRVGGVLWWVSVRGERSVRGLMVVKVFFVGIRPVLMRKGG
jgi:hypothetical protein